MTRSTKPSTMNACGHKYVCKKRLIFEQQNSHGSKSSKLFIHGLYFRRWLFPVGPRDPSCPTLGKPAQVCSQHWPEWTHNIFIYWSSVHCDLHLSLTSADQPKFRGSIEEGTGVVRLFLPGTGSTGGGAEELLVCEQLWDTAAANVACKQDGHPLWVEIHLTSHNAHTRYTYQHMVSTWAFGAVGAW